MLTSVIATTEQASRHANFCSNLLRFTRRTRVFTRIYGVVTPIYRIYGRFLAAFVGFLTTFGRDSVDFCPQMDGFRGVRAP